MKKSALKGFIKENILSNITENRTFDDPAIQWGRKPMNISDIPTTDFSRINPRIKAKIHNLDLYDDIDLFDDFQFPMDEQYFIVQNKDGNFFVNTEGYDYPRYITKIENIGEEGIDEATEEEVNNQRKFNRELSRTRDITKDMRGEDDLNEMAKISGDLRAAINSVMAANKDLEMLPLKKAILADPKVKSALGDQKMYDTQLAKFIKTAKGERVVQKRGPRVDPNKPKKIPKRSGFAKPTTDKNKNSPLGTSKLGGRKYYTSKLKNVGGEEEGPSNAALRKLATSDRATKKAEKDKLGGLKQQEKGKMVKDFLKTMRNQGIVDKANRVLDKERYAAEWAKAKVGIDSRVKKVR